jgi:tetratricopeptide (TPR) repeat protein
MQLTVTMAIKQALYQILDKYYNEQELKDLCFKLDVQYDNLAGEGKADKARELITYMERRGQLRELALTIQADRSQLIVPLPEPAPQPTTTPSIRKLNRVTILAVAVALTLIVVAWQLLRARGDNPISEKGLSTEYRVNLTLDEGCSTASVDELWELIATIVNEDERGRSVVKVEATGDVDLWLRLRCDDGEYVWTARWENRPPIFDIVGSPQEISVPLGSVATADLNRLARAMMYYGAGDYAAARDVLAELVAKYPAVGLEWLFANSLLLIEEYEETVSAYDALIPRVDGDVLAQMYNNRGLGHLDERLRREEHGFDTVAFGPLALEDLAKAQATPMTTPEVIALVNSNAGVAEALLAGPDTPMDRAREACLVAESAQPDSAWQRVCQVAVAIEPLKFRYPTPCEPDLYAEADALLDEARQLQPLLAATYYLQSYTLFYRIDGCSSPEQDDFPTQCAEYERQMVALKEAGLAPLFLHDYMIEVLPACGA